MSKPCTPSASPTRLLPLGAWWFLAGLTACGPLGITVTPLEPTPTDVTPEPGCGTPSFTLDVGDNTFEPGPEGVTLPLPTLPGQVVVLRFGDVALTTLQGARSVQGWSLADGSQIVALPPGGAASIHVGGDPCQAVTVSLSTLAVDDPAVVGLLEVEQHYVASDWNANTGNLPNRGALPGAASPPADTSAWPQPEQNLRFDANDRLTLLADPFASSSTPTFGFTVWAMRGPGHLVGTVSPDPAQLFTHGGGLAIDAAGALHARAGAGDGEHTIAPGFGAERYRSVLWRAGQELRIDGSVTPSTGTPTDVGSSAPTLGATPGLAAPFWFGDLVIAHRPLTDDQASLLGAHLDARRATYEAFDFDGDGVTGELDCDDADPERFTGAPERCDPIDHDCDGEVANGQVGVLRGDGSLDAALDASDLQPDETVLICGDVGVSGTLQGTATVHGLGAESGLTGHLVVAEGAVLTATNLSWTPSPSGALDVVGTASFTDVDLLCTNAPLLDQSAIDVTGTLTFLQGRIEGCASSTDGGAIHASGGTLTLGDPTHAVDLIDNSSALAGGVIWMLDSTLTIHNGLVAGNSAVDGGVIMASNSTVEVTGGMWSDNSALGQGGAIRQREGTLLVIGTTFEDHQGGNLGGTLFLELAESQVVDASFRRNRGRLGAGIFQNGGTLTVTDTFFEDQEAGEADCIACGQGSSIFVGNAGELQVLGGASVDGRAAFGALRAVGASVVVDATRLQGNLGLRGAAISGSDSTVTLIHILALDNTATETGGGALHLDGVSHIQVSGSLFEGNRALTATGDGGAAWLGPLVQGAVDTTFSDNHAERNGGGLRQFGAVDLTGSTFIGNSAEIGGGLSLAADDDFLLEGVAFLGNEASLVGGAIDLRSSIGEGQTLHGILQNCTFEDNEALGAGGAVRVFGNQGPVRFDGLTFRGNTSPLGGAMHLQSPDGILWEVDHSTFTDNRASTLGGAIRVSEGAMTIHETTFTGNMSLGRGGALWTQRELTLVDVDLLENTATDTGGAIYVDGQGHLDVDPQTQFVRNSAGTDGGALYLDGQQPSVISGRFEGNQAAGAAAIFTQPALTGHDLFLVDNIGTQAVLAGAGLTFNGLTVTGSSMLSGPILRQTGLWDLQLNLSTFLQHPRAELSRGNESIDLPDQVDGYLCLAADPCPIP